MKFSRFVKGLCFLYTIMAVSCDYLTKYEFPFQNPRLSIEERVEDLVSRMTLEEKISQMKYDAPAIERLGIPEYNWWNEALHGVARSGLATVFPQAIGLAATWDTVNMYLVADAISDEARAKYHDFIKKDKRGIYQGLTFWSPNINIFRDPRWGRGMETYGEDPFLTGKLAVSFINGMQGDDPRYLKTIATSKHFAVHSGPEPERHSFNAQVSEYDLRETYLPAFRTTVKLANVQSVMCAYNRFRDMACCGSNPLLQDILRDEWGFNGYVVSDCWGIRDFYEHHKIVETPEEAAALAVLSGTDLNCGIAYNFLPDAVNQGLLTEHDIDIAVKRLFRARFMLGMFDPDKLVQFSKIPYDVVDSEEHRKLALETAKKSIVLLKNEDNILPLNKGIKTLAVIGPNANDVDVLLGNYNGTPAEPITPLQGLKNKLQDTEILYARGCDLATGLPGLVPIPANSFFKSTDRQYPGLDAEYYNNADFSGTPKYIQTDPNIDFYWWDKAPKSDFDDDNFSVRWTGVIVPPVTGRYAIGAEGIHEYQFWLNDRLLVEDRFIHRTRKKYEYAHLEANKPYKIRVDYSKPYGEGSIRLLWKLPGEDMKAEALKVAREADVVIMCMGLSPRLEGEEMLVNVNGFRGGDRLTLDLPDVQRDLIQSIHRLGKPVVLVLLNGSALSINWEHDNIPAILEAWYPGQAGGTAIADIIFGDYNPSGRLPVTFYKSVNQLPPFGNYDMKGRTYRYFEGDVLYPFGHGLSYTDFEYSNLRLDKSTMRADGMTEISVDVTNNGFFRGDEVVQLYIKEDIRLEERPIKDLRGFKRITLNHNETKTISFKIGYEALKYFHPLEQREMVNPGRYTLMVGATSDESKLLKTSLNVVP